MVVNPEGVDAKWYKGAHKPLISKELWDEVQQSRGDNKGIWGSKQFAFRGLIFCGHCGASFTAQEKFKRLKNGEYNRHVYYSCTRRVDPNCTEKYINENNLRILLQSLIESQSDQIDITEKLRSKVERHNRIISSLIDHYQLESTGTSALIEYSRYILAKGTLAEQLEYSKGIKTKLVINKGEITFLNTPTYVASKVPST